MQDRLLIIQTAFIGDAALTLPMIEKLKEQNPSSVIDVIAIPGTKEIFENSPFVDDILIFEKRGKHKSLSGMLAFVKEIRKQKYSKIYSPHRSFRTSLLVLLSGVKETYGFNTASMSFVYKNKIIYRPDYHEVRRDLEIIKYGTDENNWKITPQIKQNEQAEKRIETLLEGIKGKLIAVAPGSVWETKKYPEGLFKELSGLLISSGFTVLLIGGAEDSGLCGNIAGSFGKGVYSFAGKLSLTESVFLLKKCSVLISNDSAPAHLGLMASVPVVDIYCSTAPGFGFYPYHLNSVFISYSGLSCKPCGIHGLRRCPIGTFDCAYKIEPGLIFDAVKQIAG